VAAIHEADLQTKYAGAFLPDQLERKYKAELSSSPAQTKLMPFGYKAELSSSPAQTKLMPFGYKNAAKEFIWQWFSRRNR